MFKRILLVIILCSICWGVMSNQTDRTSAVGSATVGQAVSFAFPINATSDVLVFSRITATGVSTLLTQTSNYTVSITAGLGGTVTMVTAVPLASQIHVVRKTPKTQTLDLTYGGLFNPQRIEDEFDKATRIGVENYTGYLRSLHLPETDPAVDMNLPNSIDRASKYLGFDSTGKPTVTSVAPVQINDVTVSTYIKTLLNDYNSTEARATLEIDTNNTMYANVKGYGAVGDGTTDDTDAILKAIYAVSPICTTYDSQILAGYTATGNWDANNVYRYGGIVFMPRGIYKTTSTIYLNSYVKLLGEGNQGYGSTGQENEPTGQKGTIIHFAPADTNGKTAIAISGFDKATGARYSLTADGFNYDTNCSRTFSAGIENLTIWCEPNTFQALRLANATSPVISDVTIRKDSIIGIATESSYCGTFHNVAVQSSTIGVFFHDVTVWNMSGYHTFVHRGTSQSILPFYFDDNPFTDSNDQFNTLSTGIYAIDSGQINWPSLVVESWDRGLFQYGSNYIMQAPYLEDIQTVVFNTSYASLVLNSMNINCHDANVFYCQGQGEVGHYGTGDHQIIVSGNFTIGTVYKGLIQGGLSNYAKGLIFDIPKGRWSFKGDVDYSFEKASQRYDWVYLREDIQDGTRNFAEGQVIKDVYDIIEDANLIVAFWIFDEPNLGYITDRGLQGHTLSLFKNVADFHSPTAFSYNGLAPRLDFNEPNTTKSQYADTNDDANFTFGDGSSDVNFSVVLLITPYADPCVNFVFIAKKGEANASEEWNFGSATNGVLVAKIYDVNVNHISSAYTDANIIGDHTGIHTYIMTYSGIGDSNGFCIYRDGVSQTMTTRGDTSYTAMHDTTAKVGTYDIATTNAKFIKPSKYYVIIIIRDELNSTQAKLLDVVLRSYAGAL